MHYIALYLGSDRALPSSSFAFPKPREPSERQKDDCGLSSWILQHHSFNLTAFFILKIYINIYIYIYSSVTECK